MKACINIYFQNKIAQGSWIDGSRHYMKDEGPNASECMSTITCFLFILEKNNIAGKNKLHNFSNTECWSLKDATSLTRKENKFFRFFRMFFLFISDVFAAKKLIEL